VNAIIFIDTSATKTKLKQELMVANKEVCA
jgi:hypothetical protein